MGSESKEVPKKTETKNWRNVFIGQNPVTGKPYFERRQVVVSGSSTPPEDPPLDDGLISEDEHRRRMLEQAEKDWNNATSKKGRPPIGGAVDD